MKKKDKYIIYIHEEYVKRLCQAQGAETMEQKDIVRYNLYKTINRWLRGDIKQGSILFDTFINSKGEKTRNIEIYSLSKCARIKNPKEMKRLVSKQKSLSFVELKDKEEQP